MGHETLETMVPFGWPRFRYRCVTCVSCVCCYKQFLGLTANEISGECLKRTRQAGTIDSIRCDERKNKVNDLKDTSEQPRRMAYRAFEHKQNLPEAG